MLLDLNAAQLAATVMSAMPVAVTLCSADLRYLWVSDRYAAWLDISPADIIGKPILEILGPKGMAGIRRHVDAVLAGEHVKYEELLWFKGIGERWVRAEYAPTHDASGAVDGWVACVLDVTDRKRAEQGVAVAHAALARLFELSVMPGGEEAMPTLFQAVVDTAIDITHAHMGNMQLYDETSESLRIVAQRGFQRPFLDHFAVVHHGSGSCGEAMQRREQVIVEDVSANSIFFGPTKAVMEAAHVRAVQSTLMVSREGRPLGVISTHWREPHRPSQESLRTLEIVARQAADMIEHRQQEQRVREADRRKDEFLAMLGHELRNPLGPILTAAQLMKLRADGAADKEQQIIERQAKQLVRLVDDLLDVSRITRGKVDLRKQRVELAEMVAKAVEIASPLLEQRQQRLSIDVSRRGLWVDVDPDRMTQIVTNLLMNAAQYTDRSGKINVFASSTEDAVALHVQDTGMGIAAEMLPRVFDPFVQKKQPIDRPHGGLGLGLAIVRNLVELHGGVVTARSAGEGKGSEFVVSLPRSRATDEGGETRTLSSDDTVSSPGGRILVVDDNEDAARTLSDILEAVGHEVRFAFDGPGALRIVESFTPAVALLDIGLPVMDGYELARRLRERPSLSGIKLIAITGYGQDSDRQRSRESTFEEHLVKPVDFNVLHALVRRFTLEQA